MAQNIRTRRLIGPMLLSAALLVSGCKEVLYSKLDAVEANEMATILHAAGIDVQRTQDKDGAFDIFVEGESLAAANTILRSRGLPRTKFKSMDEIFAAEGLVGTPFEERVRFMFALEEKLTEHLVSIHGVRDARVTVNIPEKSRFRETTILPSASVILHYEAILEIQSAVPKIKTVVANAVEGLTYDNVAVVTFPAAGLRLDVTETEQPISGAANALAVATRDVMVIDERKPILIAGMSLIALLSWLLIRRPRAARRKA